MRICALLALVLLGVACGSAAGQPAARLHGTVTYTRSGGFAGLYQQLRVDRQGRARATRFKPANRRSFRVSARDRGRLADALRKADLAHVRIGKSPPMSDAFHYTLTYRRYRLAFDQGNMPLQLRPPVRLLDRLMARR